MFVKVVVEQLNINGKTPAQGTPGSAGWDLYISEDKIIPAGRTALVGTGIALEIPQGWAAYIYPRSSIAMNGVLVHHPPIDCDYRGEIKVIVTNLRDDDLRVKTGERLGQLVYLPVPIVQHVPGLTTAAAQKHEGFGSTGR